VKDDLRVVPTLDELATDPAKAVMLTPEVAKALLVKVAGLHVVLLISALTTTPTPSANGTDRFLDAADVGAMIGKSKSWVEKNTESLPKRRKVGGEGKWSEREIQAWMRHRETWAK
jgi:predicted DNA-binding transcriptional regulator AlpA